MRASSSVCSAEADWCPGPGLQNLSVCTRATSAWPPSLAHLLHSHGQLRVATRTHCNCHQKKKRRKNEDVYVTKHATQHIRTFKLQRMQLKNTATENRITFRLQRKHAAKQRLQSGYKIRIATYTKSGFNFQV